MHAPMLEGAHQRKLWGYRVTEVSQSGVAAAAGQKVQEAEARMPEAGIQEFQNGRLSCTYMDRTHHLRRPLPDPQPAVAAEEGVAEEHPAAYQDSV